MSALLNEVPGFAAKVAAFAAAEGIQYDLLFSNYWLSGEVACLLRPQLAAGWAHIAHTLGPVKNQHLASGARPEPAIRIRVETEIAPQPDPLIAPTADERGELLNAYRAGPDRHFILPPC